MKNNMRIVLCLLLITFITSCTFDMLSETTFHKNRTMDLKMNIDFKKTLESPGKDMVLNMMNGILKNAAKPSKSKKRLDLSFIQTEGIDTFLMLDMALDTMHFFKADSIHKMVKLLKKENILTEDELQFLGNFVEDIFNNTIVHIQMYPAKNIMNAGIEINNLSYDEFHSKEFKTIVKKVLPDSTLKELQKSQVLSNMTWKKNKVAWKGMENGDDALKDMKNNPQTAAMIQSLMNSEMKFIYHFPDEVITNKNGSYVVSNNGKTLTLEGNFSDMLSGKLDISNVVKYRK